MPSKLSQALELPTSEDFETDPNAAEAALLEGNFSHSDRLKSPNTVSRRSLASTLVIPACRFPARALIPFELQEELPDFPY